jgi:hypothetical protein
LAEDVDPAFTYELAADGRDVETATRSRLILRGAAAGALAHAGYGNDPRLRGAANRQRERIAAFLASPLADDPWVKHEGKHVLSPDAAPPSLHFLIMLAHMPTFRIEHEDFVAMLLKYLTRPQPKHEPQQLVGTRVLLNPYLILGDPIASRGMIDSDVPFVVFWLELMARMGVLDRHEGWKRQFERMLDDRDRDMVWRASRSQTTVTTRPVLWPFTGLGTPGDEGAALEITFRLGLIGKIAGREVNLVS